jgi:hypothetical protein
MSKNVLLQTLFARLKVYTLLTISLFQLKKSSVYLFRAALYKLLISLLNKEASVYI